MKERGPPQLERRARCLEKRGAALGRRLVLSRIDEQLPHGHGRSKMYATAGFVSSRYVINQRVGSVISIRREAIMLRHVDVIKDYLSGYLNSLFGCRLQ